MQHFFGTGGLVATSTASGTQTPRKFGVLQDISLECSFNLKELHGQKAFAVAIGRGMGKVSCKAKTGTLDARALSDLLFTPTATPTTTQRLVVEDESGTPAGTPPIVTVANTTGVKDLGVVNAVSGIPLVKVAASPGPAAANEYSVNEGTGVYTFNTGFADKVFVTYSYTATITEKSNLVVDNQIMGKAPFFSAVLHGVYDQVGSGGATVQKNWYIKLPGCMASKWAIQTKQEDFMIPEFEFSAFADASGTIMEVSFEE